MNPKNFIPKSIMLLGKEWKIKTEPEGFLHNGERHEGLCDNQKKEITICLNPLCHSVLETLLEEICHAFLFLQDRDANTEHRASLSALFWADVFTQLYSQDNKIKHREAKHVRRKKRN